MVFVFTKNQEMVQLGNPRKLSKISTSSNLDPIDPAVLKRTDQVYLLK